MVRENMCPVSVWKKSVTVWVALGMNADNKKIPASGPWNDESKDMEI